MSELLQQAIDLARSAGAEVMKIYSRDFSFEDKQDKSPVTTADITSEKIILQGLKKTGIAVLSEETPPGGGWYKQNKIWIVDPLDGTVDFIQKTGEFSIMLGLVVSKEPVLGVVYQPAEDKIYFAEKNKGAFLQQGKGKPKRIQVSDINNFEKATVILSRNHTSQAQKDFVEKQGFGGVKHIGSAGLKIGAVASGKAEAYFTESNKIHQWDTAAGYCILKQAGGKVADLRGMPLTYCCQKTNHSNGILACNASLYPKLLQSLKHFFSYRVPDTVTLFCS